MINILIILILNIIIYWRTIRFDIIIDDIQRRRAADERDWYNNWTWYGIINRLYGAGMFKSYKLDHAFTLFLHTLSALCVYLCFGSTPASFLAAIIYSVHPINNQTAVWLNGRRYIVNAILVMLIWALRPYSIILYLITPLFQATAFAAPLLYLVTPYWYFAFLLPCFPFLHNKTIINKIESRTSLSRKQASTMAKNESHRFKIQKLVFVVKTFGHYFWHLLIPIEIAFYNTKFQELSITRSGTKKCYRFDKDFLIGLGAIITIITLFAIFPQIRFYLFWYVIFISQWCNFITLTQSLADRYTSVAIIGYVLALSSLLVSHPFLLALLCGYYIAKNFQIQRMYKTIDEFYLYHVYHVPQNVLGILFYVKACLSSGLYYHAYVAVRKCLDHNPNDYRVLITMAKVLKAIGHTKEVNKFLDRAKETVPDFIYMPEDKLYQIIEEIRV
jgi:hypothetical protein